MKKLLLGFIVLFFIHPVFSKNIAIIPFQNITGDKEKNWIGAGFAETLTTKIVKAPGITVIERENLSKILEEIKFQYSGACDENNAVEKGKIYGADVMVFGSFQVMGDKLKITARFVDVETRKIIDTTEANGNIPDIFQLQDEIAFSLLDSLKVVLGEKEKEKIKVNPTENLTEYQWFSKGLGADSLKIYDEAIEHYTKAIETNPKIAAFYRYRGVDYGKKGLFYEEIEDYTKAIQINPEYAEIYYHDRGIAYDKKGLSDKAIENYTKIIELAPKDSYAYCNRGVAYDKKGLFDKAIEDYTKAIKLDPKNEYAYCNRGVSYGKKGLFDKAIEDYTKAIELNPKYAEAYNNRGYVYDKKGLSDKAIENYTKAFKLAAVTYIRGLGYFYIKGLYNNAIEDCTKAIELDPKDAGAYYNRGNAYYYNKCLYDEAIEDYTKAIELNPKYADAYNNRGLIYAIKGLRNLCISDLKRATDLGVEEGREFIEARLFLKKFFNIDY